MSTHQSSSTDFIHVHHTGAGAGCGSAQCGDQWDEATVDSWYDYLDKITQNPAQLWECNLPSKDKTDMTPMTKPIQTADDWNNRLLHHPLDRDTPDTVDIRNAPKTASLWTTLPFFAEADRDHATVSALRLEAHRVAKAEYGCHKCANAISDLVIQFGPTGPLLFQHNPDYSPTTQHLHGIALQIWKWVGVDPPRRLRLRLATEQRLKNNTYWGPSAKDAIRASALRIQNRKDTAPPDQQDLLQAQYLEKMIELENRSVRIERYRHYVNHAHSVIPDGIRTQPRKIQMCDVALRNHFTNAYNLFAKLTMAWTSRRAAAAGLQRFHDIHQGLQDVTHGIDHYGEAIHLLLESMTEMDGRPFVNRPLEERIAIVGRYLGKAKKGRDGNGDNGVVVFALNQANNSLANLAEKAVSPEGLRAMIEDLVDPMKRMRRDASKVVSEGQIASTERDLGNFGTECATLESLERMYRSTGRKRVWKKPIYAPDPYHTTGGTFGALRQETASHHQNRYAPQWDQTQVVQFDSLEGLLDAVERGNQVWINVPSNADYITLVHMRNVADPEMWSCRPVEDQDPLGWEFNKGSAPTYCPRQDTYVEVVGGHHLKTGAYDNIILVLKDSQAMLEWACLKPRMGSWCLSSMGSRKHSTTVEKISQSTDPATRMRPCAAGESPVIGLGFNHEHNKVTKRFTCRVRDSKGNYKYILPTDYTGSPATYVPVVQSVRSSHTPKPKPKPLPPNPSGADTYRGFMSNGKNSRNTYGSRPQSAPRGKVKGHTYASRPQSAQLPQCRSCNQLISSLAKFCSLCGAPQ